jgi:hypothetical protein
MLDGGNIVSMIHLSSFPRMSHYLVEPLDSVNHHWLRQGNFPSVLSGILFVTNDVINIVI